MVAILGFSKDQITAAVQAMYAEVALAPTHPFHFPVGRAGARAVGYPDPQLDGLPPEALASFAGVGYPFRAGVIRPGDEVLDIGAGSGTDTLIASRLVGERGKVWALDITPGMLTKLRATVHAADIRNVEVIEGDAERIFLAGQQRRRGHEQWRAQPCPRQAARLFRDLPGVAPGRPCADRRHRDRPSGPDRRCTAPRLASGG